MSDVVNAIMDAAERRIRVGGFNGFSFREIAADVGIKSSSVHYHFPTKEILAAAVVRRYTNTAVQCLDFEMQNDPNTIAAWVRAFRKTLTSNDKICPCTVLGAGALDLPKEVATEVNHFYRVYLNKLESGGLSADQAAEVLALLSGAAVLTIALNDISIFDQSTRSLLEQSKMATA